MFQILIVLITICTLSESQNIDSKKCHDPKEDFYPYFGTRTAYHFVRGNITRPSDCEPQQIWMMSRHAVRYPAVNLTKKFLSVGHMRDQIVKNHEQGAGELCAEDLEKLRQWQLDSNVTIESAATITPQGEKDLQKLAERLRNSFPKLLKSNNTDDYLFTSTVQRSAIDSLKIFAPELVGYSRGLNLEVLRTNDAILISHKNCPIWDETFALEHVYDERNKFISGPEIGQLLKDFSRRLGYSNTVDSSTARLAYDVCRYETAWNQDKLSTWCILFTKHELMVLEYLEDLDLYYHGGPGRKISSKLNCPSVRNMFQRFGHIVNGNIDDEPKGVFYLAHTTNIQSLISVLHMYQQSSPLLASKFESSKNRMFRISLLGAFNANLIAVLYKCADMNSPYKVMFYLNENLVKMDGCVDGICDWELLKRKFEPELEYCSLDFCYDVSTKD